MPYPCCCNQTIECSGSIIVTMSGVTNGSCSSCGTQYNDSVVTFSGGTGGGWVAECGKTLDTTFCTWGFGQDNNPCFADDNDSNVAMFTATDGKKYVGVRLEDETLGGFGETFAIWVKEITAFTLPQTLTSADQCYMAHAKCDFSGVTITLSAP